VKKYLHLAWKITGHFSLTVPLSLLEVSRFVGGVRAPGGASGNFQSRVRTVSLHDISLRGPTEEEEEEEKKKKKKEEDYYYYYMKKKKKKKKETTTKNLLHR
jgi:hypothetical protein